MKRMKSRLGRMLVVPVILLSLLGSVVLTAIDASPAAAATKCVVARGGAPCEPGVSPAQYHAALYICTQAQAEFGAYQYKQEWPSLRTCMDFALIWNTVNVVAVYLYTTDLYIHYHSDQWVWQVYNSYYDFMDVVAKAWAILGHDIYELVLPIICTSVAAGAPETIAGLAGLGCDEAFAVVALSHGWKG